MKRRRGLFLCFLFTLILSSCATRVEKSSISEDEMVVTRKYVGNFVDYKLTAPSKLGDPNLLWIKTTLNSSYGILTAYGKECNFKTDERLYLREVFYTPGIISGYWVYQIENSTGSDYYRLSEYQNDKKVLVKDWFVTSSTE